jgi:translocation and assembly module TamB
MAWPLGRFSAGVRGEGAVTIEPPAGAAVLGRVATSEATGEYERLGKPWGPFAPRVPLGYVPIGAALDYRFDPDWVEILAGRFATARTYVEFAGRTAYGRDSRIPFHVTSADWLESDRLLVGIMNAFGSDASAVDVGGWGEFDGVMLGAFRDPRIEGRFSGRQLRAWDVVWGDGGGSIVIEDSYVTVDKAVIRREGSEIEANGRFALGYPRRDGGEEINARVRLARRSLADLRHAFLLDDYDVDGRLSGEFHLYGKYETPFGFGKLQIDEGVAYGEPFESATASLRFEGNGVRLDGIEARKSDGSLAGAAFVEWAGTYSFSVTGRRIPVESLALLEYPDARLSGLLEFTASGSGRFEEPRYDVRFDVHDLYVRDEGIGEVTGRLAVRDTTLTLEMDAASPRLSVSGTGRIALTEQSDAELTFRFTETSLDPYVRVFRPELSPFTTAIVSGSVRIAGELANREHLVVDSTLDDVRLRLFDYELRNDGAIRLQLDRQVARIAAMRLVGENTRLEVSGTIDTAAQALDVHATGAADLAILQGFFRDISASGGADLQADVRGTVERPEISGSASIAGGRIRHFSLPHSLDALNGRMAFDAGGIRLDGLTARLGGGLVRFGGRIGLSGFTPHEINVTAVGEDMRLRYPEGFRSVIDADLALRGTVESAVLSGGVLVKSSVLSRRLEVTGNFLEFAGRGAPAAAAVPETPDAIPLRFDVRVVAPASLRIENNVARITSSADLTLRGTYDRPLVFGRAEIDRGEIVFEGKRYVVTRGTVDFSNPTRIEPFFDVEAETRVRVPGQTYRVTLSAVGTIARFQHALNSDPPLPTVDILSLLLSNTAPADPELAQLRSPEIAEQQLLQARAAQLLVSPLSAGVGRVVEQTFGVDSFQISPSLNDPTQQSSRFNPGARLTIGKRISDRAYLTFSQSLTPQSTSRDQIILLEYDQNDRLSWLLSQNEDRTYALEVRVRHAY